MAGTNSDSDVRWTAPQQPGLADQPLRMWGDQDGKMSAKHWSRRKALSQWKYLFVSIENANGCKCIPLSTWYMLTDHNDVSACTSCTWIMIDQILELERHIPCKVLAQDVSRHLLRILTVESECRPKMASIQRTPAWTGLFRSCYCSPPTFGPSLVPYVGNFSVFARRITWPIFARWGEPKFLLEHACDLSMHDSSRWSLLISWYRSKNW